LVVYADPDKTPEAKEELDQLVQKPRSFPTAVFIGEVILPLALTGPGDMPPEAIANLVKEGLDWPSKHPKSD
jgi:hypothetical protein